MKLSDSNWKETIGKHFDYTLDFDFLDVIADLVERVDLDSDDLTEEVSCALDEGLIYTEDVWTIAKYYFSSPCGIDELELYDLLFNDVYSICEEIKEL